MLLPGLYLLSEERCSATPITPDELAESHPLWRAAMERYAPWSSDTADNIEEIKFAGSAAQAEAPIIICNGCETTMDSVRCFAEAELLDDWGALVAVNQFHPRGQLRREWISAPGNLHISMLLPPPPMVGAWNEILTIVQPILVGYVISEVLSELGVLTELKWPNDLLQRGRKIGGILVEERSGRTVVGFGLNVVNCPSENLLREGRAAPAGLVNRGITPPDAGMVALALVNRGKSIYMKLLDTIKPTEFAELAAHKLAWFGEPVLVTGHEEQPYRARIVGLTRKGGLLLDRDGRRVELYSGSVAPY